MKSQTPVFLTAREAAAELSVSPATLYAYVSRGLIRSEPIEGRRDKRYRADDVRGLKNRRPPPLALAPAAATLPVLDSAVSTITDEGPIYRGVPALALAGAATLEQTATLLWDASGSDPFEADNLPVTSDAMRAVLDATRGEAPMARAIAVLALACDADPRAFNRSADGRAAIGARIMRLVAAAVLGAAPSAAPLHQQLAGEWAPDSARAAELVRRALVLLADHELNASAYTLRCAASTGLDLYDATIAGLVALKGPKHGGAGPLAARMLASLGDGDMAGKVRERVALGERISGFGHSVYKHGDPRARDLLAALVASGADRKLAVELPAIITDATGLYPNIDFALAVLMRTLGLPIGHETVLFAVARSAGWIAHGIEQLQSGNLIRPSARYVGPAPGRSAGQGKPPAPASPLSA